MKPLYHISQFLCTILYNLDRKGVVTRSKVTKFYVLRLLIYSLIFMLGNLYVKDVVSTSSLDKMAFLLANVSLITLAVYGMIWSILMQSKQIKVLHLLRGKNDKVLVWFEVIGLCIYFATSIILIGYTSGIIISFKYTVFFVLPDIFVYTTLISFINVVLLLKNRLQILMEEIRPDSEIKDLTEKYQDLYLIASKINNLYGLMCLWAVATFFLWILCDLYRFINDLTITKTRIDTILSASLLSTIIHYFVLFVMVAVCNCTKNKAESFKVSFVRLILEKEEEPFPERVLCL